MFDGPPELLPPAEQVIEQRLLDCGLDLGGFTVKYENYLQSIEIRIKPSARATSDHFACIKDAAGFGIVTFEDGAVNAAYIDFVAELTRPETIAMLEERLKEAGIWEGFPERENFLSLQDFIEALEVHVGLEPRSALRLSGQSILFDPRSGIENYGDFASRYSDLLNVVLYASIRDRLDFGFLGNEKASE